MATAVSRSTGRPCGPGMAAPSKQRAAVELGRGGLTTMSGHNGTGTGRAFADWGRGRHPGQRWFPTTGGVSYKQAVSQ